MSKAGKALSDNKRPSALNRRGKTPKVVSSLKKFKSKNPITMGTGERGRKERQIRHSAKGSSRKRVTGGINR